MSRGYFENIAYHLKSTAVGMGVTIKHMFQTGKGADKHALYCYQYPDEGVERMREEVSERHRGIHFLEPSKCIMCFMCSKVCPVQCIVIEGVRLGKDQLLSRFTIDYSKCLFCGLCTEPCPTDCIHHGREWDYSGFSRDTLVKDMLRNRVYTPAAHQEYVAAHEEGKLIEAEYKKVAAAEKAKAAALKPPAPAVPAAGTAVAAKPATPAAAPVAKPAAPATPAKPAAEAPAAIAPAPVAPAPAKPVPVPEAAKAEIPKPVDTQLPPGVKPASLSTPGSADKTKLPQSAGEARAPESLKAAPPAPKAPELGARTEAVPIPPQQQPMPSTDPSRVDQRKIAHPPKDTPGAVPPAPASQKPSPLTDEDPMRRGARTEKLPPPRPIDRSPTREIPSLAQRKETEKLPQREVPRPVTPQSLTPVEPPAGPLTPPLPLSWEPVASPVKPVQPQALPPEPIELGPAPLDLEPELAPEPELEPNDDESLN